LPSEKRFRTAFLYALAEGACHAVSWFWPSAKTVLSAVGRILVSDKCTGGLRAGALGASLSGAGPCLIAYTLENEEAVGQAMVEAFKEHEIKAHALQLSLDAHGARILKHR